MSFHDELHLPSPQKGQLSISNDCNKNHCHLQSTTVGDGSSRHILYIVNGVVTQDSPTA